MNHKVSIRQQYTFVQGARGRLLNYCEGISDEDFVKENSSFGKGSIRNLLVHTAATYQYWIGKCCLKREMVFTEREDVNNFQLRFIHAIP